MSELRFNLSIAESLTLGVLNSQVLPFFLRNKGLLYGMFEGLIIACSDHPQWESNPGPQVQGPDALADCATSSPY